MSRRSPTYRGCISGTNAKRRAKGRTRMVPPHRVAVPRPLGPSTQRRILATLSAAMQTAAEQRMVTRNPAHHAKLPTKQQTERVRPPTPQQYGQFLDAVESDRLYPVFLLDADTLAVLKTWRRQQLEERMQWSPAYQDGGWVFTWQSGEPHHPEYISKRYAWPAREHGMPSRIHSLRHFRASALIDAGANLSTLSKLGHKTIAITSDTYGHLFDSTAKDLAERAAGYVPAALRPRNLTTT